MGSSPAEGAKCPDRSEDSRSGRAVRANEACADPACTWCRERHDAARELKRWLNFTEFRPEPRDAYGRPLQQLIVEAAMGGTRRAIRYIRPSPGSRPATRSPSPETADAGSSSTDRAGWSDGSRVPSSRQRT